MISLIECAKKNTHIQKTFSLDNDYIMNVFKKHEKVLIYLFTQDEIINNFKLTINTHLESFNKVSETFWVQIEMTNNIDKNIDLFQKNFP